MHEQDFCQSISWCPTTANWTVYGIVLFGIVCVMRSTLSWGREVLGFSNKSDVVWNELSLHSMLSLQTQFSLYTQYYTFNTLSHRYLVEIKFSSWLGGSAFMLALWSDIDNNQCYNFTTENLKKFIKIKKKYFRLNSS